MADQEVHAITDELAQVKVDTPTEKPVQSLPADHEERTLKGLSRGLNTWRTKALAAEAELEKVRGTQGTQGTQSDQNVAKAITEEINKADEAHDWKSDALRLAQELKEARAEQKFNNDPLVRELIKRGMPVERLDEDFYELLRRVRDDDGEPTPAHNPPSSRRGRTQAELDEDLIRIAGSSAMFP